MLFLNCVLKIPGYMSSQEEPRFLTRDEISLILSRLAKPQIMCSELREHIYNQIRNIYGYQLGIIKLKPSKIEKLGDYIANKSERSFYQPGTPIGFNVAESVGQPATQLVLNTFHSAGQSGAAGFDRFKQNIALKDYRKNEKEFNMKIHMYNKDYSFEDLYIKAQSFISVTISSLLDNSRIRRERYPFEDMSIYTDEFKKINTYKDRGCGIRLRFDREKLLLHQIPLEIIALELEKASEGDLFTLFFGPNLEGIIDIYPNPDRLCDSDNVDLKECCTIFENGILKNKLNSSTIGDYLHISSASVKKLPVSKCISNVTEDYAEDDKISKNTVRVWVNKVYMKKEGIPSSKIEDLLNETGYSVINADDGGNYFVVESNSLNVISEIKKMIKKEDDSLIDHFSKTGRLISSDLYKAAYYNIITTSGTDLAKVRNNPEVDEYHTISDSPSEIYAVYGIEVCRAYLEKEIYDLFEENDQLIAPRNIKIMVDWMTSGLHPISVNPKSVYKTDNSIMRAFCFESPRNAIVKGAVLSTNESLSNVSARVLFGQQQTLGTGAFKVREDPEIRELYDNLKSEDSVGAFRLTSDTLRKSVLPQAANDLFDEDLSVGSSFEF